MPTDMELLQEQLNLTQQELHNTQVVVQSLQDPARITIPTAVLTGSFDKVTQEIRASSMGRSIRTFSGQGIQKLHDFLKDVERITLAVNASDEQVRALTLQSVTGVASTFLLKYLTDHKDANWDSIKKAIKERFSDLADEQVAAQKLRTLHQNKEESVQTFAERVEDVASDAYPTAVTTDKFFQQTLVQIFKDGLREDGIVRKLIKERPETLEKAVSSATVAQQNTRAFALRRGRQEEDMEVDMISEDQRIKKVEDQMSSLTQKMDSLADMMKGMASGGYPRGQRNNYGARPKTKSDFKFTADGKPICSHCDKPGHIKRDCFKWKAEKGNSTGRRQ